mgnify:CR=1 FL=1
MPVPALVAVKPRGGKLEKSPIDAAKVLEGKPTTGLRNDFTNAKGKFHCGIWTSPSGTWTVSYGEDEFIVLLEGTVKLTPEGGRAKTFKAPQAFVIPKGFKGTWETLEPVRKYYAIAE